MSQVHQQVEGEWRDGSNRGLLLSVTCDKCRFVWTEKLAKERSKEDWNFPGGWMIFESSEPCRVGAFKYDLCPTCALVMDDMLQEFGFVRGRDIVKYIPDPNRGWR